MTLCDRLNTPRHKYCKGCRNTAVQNIAVIKEAAAPARLGTPTYPKDEIENEKQIFHTFHPALHFTHGSAGIVAFTADISYQDFCNFLSQLDINHTDTVENGRCIQTSAQSLHSAAARRLTPPTCARAHPDEVPHPCARTP